MSDEAAPWLSYKSDNPATIAAQKRLAAAKEAAAKGSLKFSGPPPGMPKKKATDAWTGIKEQHNRQKKMARKTKAFRPGSEKEDLAEQN